PHEFSGGMRQRSVIAIALAGDPKVLIADEPTTALDVTIQSQILDLINDIQKRTGIAILFITHDLGVVANVADRVAVMYAGKIVEIGTADDIFHDPRHPYTWGLLSSLPSIDDDEKTLNAIPGTPPDLLHPPKGDAFAVRNPYAMAIDYKEEAPLFKVSDTHYAATWLLDERAPKIKPPIKVINGKIVRLREDKVDEW
ncbi:MAG: ABC transporter ATP-binding protein, partial [Eubacterium sp.]